MSGMLVGGLLWGIMGDLKGRKSVLFGSIMLYSVANIANAFVTTIPQYQIVRFIAGLGLAGELGAAITLVSEIMHREHRGFGTMLIVAMGALGAVAAALMNRVHMGILGLQSWQEAYIVGGLLGLCLLFMRMGTFESGMFDALKKEKGITKGNFFLLFKDRHRFLKYLACILVGLPVWYCVAILIKFSPSFAKITGVSGPPVEVGFSIMYAYIGLSVGDLFSGLLSQYLKSRKKVILIYLVSTILLVGVFLFVPGFSTSTYYFLCFLLGCATGYWALFVSVASEQFGTNIRSTVTTTIPNFVRGAVIPITLSFKSLESGHGSVYAAVVVGVVCIGIAIAATLYLKETFAKDLDYLEQ
jgi:putative MFS transporter